ncbi:hypothetical protein AXF42_Ash009312 [Apostasia shenzhenica]|uniref:Uncharacterized protein n=1 Tax=Apostasia shenzhenica TaxID=1088818 RepID=A0A2I0B3Q2_9ASPA|nr:hypothetical protein AXF42_Ash009312 [Apostasia shenzhenica]
MIRKNEPADCPFDLAVAAAGATALAFSLLSAVLVLRFQLLSTGSPRRLRNLNSLWPVRLLLILFAALLVLAELLRIPLLLRRLPPHTCAAHSLVSVAFAEPAFYSTLLFLLRASTHPKLPSAAFSSASVAAVAAALPFFLLLSIFVSLPDSFFLSLGLPIDFLGHGRRSCDVPLFAAVLLAALAALYVPLFVTACWTAVAVVINKRLRVRLYALAASVVASLSIQVAALALASLWAPETAVHQALSLSAYVSLLVSVVAGEAILVVQPVVDSLSVVDSGDDRRLSGGAEC